MRISDDKIKVGIDKAYKKARHNAYFANGFEAGVRFAEEQFEILNKHFVRRSADTPSRPLPGDYFESHCEGMNPSTRVEGLTWKEEYERDLAHWERHYA